jgi:type I restriction enzyme M protein
VKTDDAQRATPTDHFHVVLTNPPFGKKSSVLIVNAEGEEARQALTVVRDDFWVSTINEQLDFVQHVKSLLEIGGRAAVVLPDNVLFEGGAGESVRRKPLHECDVHTLLRLPTGISYAQGVEANVLLFDKRPGSAEAATRKLWIHDFRTNLHFTLESRRLQRPDLDEFVSCYHPENRHDRKPTGSEKNPEGAAGAPSPTTSWSSATRRTSTSSGSATRAWRAPRGCRIPTSSRLRSPRIWRLHSSSFERSPRT